MIDLERLAEAERDLLLRRMDWRFLLPRPELGRTVCFTDGLLAEGAAALTSEVLQIEGAAGEADLAIAVDPDRICLQRAHERLRPGGSLYAEWIGVAGLRPRRVRRRLEGAGFRDVRVYWVWPPPRRRRPWFWVPIESPGVRRFVRDSRPPGRGLQRIVLLAQRLAWRLLTDAGFAWPIVTLAMKPGGPPAPASPHQDLELQPAASQGLSSNGGEPIKERTPEQSLPLLLTRGERSVNKVVTLLFAPGESRPRLAVKQSRTAAAEAGLLREAEVLASLARARSGQPAGVPRLVRCDRNGNGPRVVESALVGIPLCTILPRSDYRLVSLRSADWLARLAATAQVEEPARWWRRLVGDVLDRFEREFVGVAEPGLLAATREVLCGLGPLRRCCEHRDFSPWNVHVADDGTWLAFDWESAEPRGLPALDLFYFLGYLAFFRERAATLEEWRRCYRASLDTASATGRAHRDALLRYAAAIGTSEQALRPLRLLVWPLHAHSEVVLFTQDRGGQPPTAPDLRRSLFLALWEEEVRALG